MKTILLVDDEETLREIIAMQLEDDGYNILQAGSGNDAFEIVKKNEIDLIISDMRMPNGSGEDLLKSLNNLDKKPPFILVTGFSELTKDDAIKLGAHDMLSKPIDFDELESHIEKLLA